nr:CPBP family intramembrane glutamic endopeptidase [Motilibacter deserti]
MSGVPVWALAVVAVLSVVVAPVVEELLFRGLLLRGLMTRLRFWPAALISSALFGLMHAPTALTGAPAVVLHTGALGLVLCLLTRRTGRLVPAVLVHALHNGLALAAVALVA